MRTLKDLLATPSTQLGRIGRFLVYQHKLWPHCLRLLVKNRAAQLAAALSYYTIFGIVPLVIVIVLIFHSIPAYREVGEQLKNIVYRELRLTRIEYPNPENPEERVVLTEYLDAIINRFFTGMEKSSLGIISAVLVIWAALRLLSIIESAFDHMWYVPVGRRFLHRIINYWALLTLVPLLLAAGLYATTRFSILHELETSATATLGSIISYGLSTLALFVLYLVMPNAKVQAWAAFWGAAVASLVWSFAKWGFGVYVTQLIPYNAFYGVLGLIPLAVFWVYITWLILLLGLQLTFTIQHIGTLETAEAPKVKEAEGRFIANDMTAILVARELAVAFEDNQGPLDIDALCARLDIPGEFGQKFLAELVKQGLLARTSEPRRGYLLARDPEHIRLSDIADAVATAAFGQPIPQEHGTLDRIARAQRALLAQHNLKEILDSAGATAERSSRTRENPPAEEEHPEEPPVA